MIAKPNLPKPDAVTFQKLMLFYSKESLPSSVIELYQSFLVPTLQSHEPAALLNNRSYTASLAIFRHVLTAYESLRMGEKGEEVLDKMVELGFPATAYDYLTVMTSYADPTHYSSLDSQAHVTRLFGRMLKQDVKRTVRVYNVVVSVLRRVGDWARALRYLSAMKMEGIPPDTVTYSAAISACVEGKQWELALELLGNMEEENVTRNVITYNSVIEALDSAGETVRAELVYQSALRSGIYSHWSADEDVQADKQLPSVQKMDLHKFPVSVAKSAIMHVLGEMCIGVIPTTTVVVVTGRGNHLNRDGSRGVLRKELKSFFSELLGLYWKEDSHNPGRMILERQELLRWMNFQRDANQSSGAHSNLFLQVAYAKRKSAPANVRAICPFSGATMDQQHPKTSV